MGPGSRDTSASCLAGRLAVHTRDIPLAKSNPACYTDRHKGDMVRPGEVVAVTLRRIRPSVELGPWAASLARVVVVTAISHGHDKSKVKEPDAERSCALARDVSKCSTA
jgi:hypothetical protein